MMKSWLFCSLLVVALLTHNVYTQDDIDIEEDFEDDEEIVEEPPTLQPMERVSDINIQ